MFDASFLELLIVSVVALLVLGPERLPGAIRTAGLWIGRLRRSFNNIKRDIEKEIGADDIRRQLRNEAIMEKFDSTKSQFTKTIDSIKKETTAIKEDLQFEKEVTGFMGENKSSETSPDKTDEPAKAAIDADVSSPAPSTPTPTTPDMFASNSDDNATASTEPQPDSSAKTKETK